MRSSVRHQLLVIIVLIVVCVLANTVISSVGAQQRAEKEARSKAEESAKVYKEHLQAQLGNLQGALNQLTTAMVTMKQTGHTDRKLADAFQEEMLRTNPSLLATWTIFEPNAFDGRDAAYANTDQSDSTGRYIPWWHRDNGEIVMSPSSSYAKPAPDSDWYTQPKNEMRTIVEEPYSDPDLHVFLSTVAQPIMYEGKLIGVAGIDALLSETETYLADAKPLGTGYAALYSSTGIVVSQPGKKAGEQADDAVLALTKVAKAAGKPILRSGVDPVTKEKSLRHVMPLRLSAKETWTLVVSLPERSVMASANATRNATIGVGIVILVLLVGATLFLARRITNALSTQSTQVQAATEHLNIASHELQQSTEISSAQASEATRDTRAVNEEIATVATAVEEVTSSVSEIASHAHVAAQSASAAVDAASEAARTMESLGEASSEISSVIDLIRSISEETNLLALNATIESARAGEAGKGFAVVANEVKDLARQTADATERIVQNVDAIKSGNTAAQQVIRDITNRITEIASMQNEIGNAVEQHSSTTSEIATHVSRVAANSDRIAERMEDVERAITTTEMTTRSVISSAEGLGEVASDLGSLAGTTLHQV